MRRLPIILAFCLSASGHASRAQLLNHDVIWAHVGTNLTALDEAGRAVSAAAGVTGVARGIAIDGNRRVWATFDGNRVVVHDAINGGTQTITTNAPVGAIAVDAAGRVFTGNPTVASPPANLVRFDATGTQTGTWTTWGWVQQIVIDAAGRVVTLETPITGSSRLRAYDASSGAVLIERSGLSLQSRIWPRPGGGFVVTQLDDPTIASWSGDAVGLLDAAFNTTGGFSTIPEFLPTHVAEGLDGRLHVAHAVTTAGYPQVRSYDASGTLLAAAATAAGPRSLTIDGKGRLLVACSGAHAPGGSPITLEKFDSELIPFWAESLGTTTNLGASRLGGDPTGMLHCLVTNPQGDLDGDGRPNAQEIANGTDPLDPWSYPSTVTPGGSPTPGSTYTLTLTAPEDAGLPYRLAWSFSGSPTPLAMVGTGDWRSVELNPFAPGGGFDFLYLLSTTAAGAGLFSGTTGTLDTTGAATTSVAIPNIPALSGTRVFAAFVTLEPASPSGLKTLSRRFPVTIN